MHIEKMVVSSQNAMWIRNGKTYLGKNESNHPWQLYITTYRVDFWKHCYNYFLLWKYRHSPMRHVFSIAIIAAHKMNLECADYNLYPEWYMDSMECINFWILWLKASKIMLIYDPALGIYPGDNMMQGFTRQPCKQQSCSPAVSSISRSSNKKQKIWQYMQQEKNLLKHQL